MASTSKDFWNWFIANRESLASMVRASTAADVRARLYGALNDRFVAAYPDIIAEVGPAEVGAELVVSADGRREFFPAVIACVADAPAVA